MLNIAVKLVDEISLKTNIDAKLATKVIPYTLILNVPIPFFVFRKRKRKANIIIPDIEIRMLFSIINLSIFSSNLHFFLCICK
mgnify:CR=1 FL=1